MRIQFFSVFIEKIADFAAHPSEQPVIAEPGLVFAFVEDGIKFAQELQEITAKTLLEVLLAIIFIMRVQGT